MARQRGTSGRRVGSNGESGAVGIISRGAGAEAGVGAVPMASVLSASGQAIMPLQIQQRLWVQALSMIYLMIILGSGIMKNTLVWVSFHMFISF